IVLDRGRIGQGATAACAGGIRAQFSTEVNIRMGMEAKRVLSRFVDETGQSADFRQVGYLFLLTTDDERARFAEAVRLQRRLGVEDVVELSPSGARAIVPGLETDDLAGATFCPSAGSPRRNGRTYDGAIAIRRGDSVVRAATPVDAFGRAGQTVVGGFVRDDARLSTADRSAPVGPLGGRRFFRPRLHDGARRGSLAGHLDSRGLAAQRLRRLRSQPLSDWRPAARAQRGVMG